MASPPAGPPATTGLPPTPGQDYTRRVRRYSAVWAIIVIVVAIVAGLGGFYYGKGQATTTSTSTVTYYDDLAPSEETFMTTTLIPMFEQEHPNINVVYVNANAQAIVTEIEGLVQGHDVGSTLIAEDNLEIGALIYGGTSGTTNYLMNLTPIASSIEPSQMISSMTAVVNYETTAFGGQYFVPFRANTPLVFFNKTALSGSGISSGPANFSALLSDAQKLGSSSVMFQGGAGDDTATEMFQWDVQFGGNPMVYNDMGDLQATSYLYNLSKYFNPGYKQAIYSEYAGLAQGKYQILDYQWPYVYPLLTGGNTSIHAMSSTTLGVYAGPNGTGTHAAAHVIGGDVLAIPVGASDVGAIETFANFLLSAPAQQVFMVDTGNPAVNAQAYVGLPSNVSTVDAAIEAALANPVFRPPVGWIEEWVTLYYNDIFTPFVVNHAGGGSWSTLVTDANTANSALHSWIGQYYGSSAAATYASGGYGPLYV